MRPQSVSFDVDVEAMPAQFLVQTMQCDMNLGNSYRHAQLLHVYKLCVRALKFTVISDHSRRMTSPSEARRFVKNSFQN
jgi:hypothetical protein